MASGGKVIDRLSVRALPIGGRPAPVRLPPRPCFLSTAVEGDQPSGAGDGFFLRLVGDVTADKRLGIGIAVHREAVPSAARDAFGNDDRRVLGDFGLDDVGAHWFVPFVFVFLILCADYTRYNQ